MHTIKLSVNEEEFTQKNKKFINKDPLLIKEVKKEKKHFLKKFFMFSGIFFVVILTALITYAYFNIYVPYQHIKDNTSEIQSIFASIKSDIENKDITTLNSKVSLIKSKLVNIQDQVSSLSFLDGVPVATGYIQNANKAVNIGNHAFNIFEESIPSVTKTLTSMGYKTSLNVNGSNLKDEERLGAFMQRVPDIADTYQSVEPKVLSLIDEIGTLDPSFLPKFNSVDMSKIIDQIRSSKSDFSVVSEKLKETLKVLPKLMGSDGSSRYLIIFNNENELRASGGIISAYGFMDINKGKINDKIDANDSWYIQQYIWEHKIPIGLYNPPGQAYWMNKGCGSNELRVQDSGVYPDNIVNMQTFNKYYDAAASFESRNYGPTHVKDFPKYDAAIVISTAFASDLLSTVQPLEMPAYNVTLNARNLAEQMSYQTELANKKYSTGTKERKTFVKDVSTALKDKITKSGVNILPKVINAFVSGLQQKHVFMYSKDIDLQNFFDKWGVTGEIAPKFNGDYLNVSEAQNCSLKSNLFVKDTVTQNINILPNGSINKNVKIDWINPQIPRIDQTNIFNVQYPYRAWVRLFVPNDATFVSSKNGLDTQSIASLDKVMDKESIENLIYFQWRTSLKAPVAGYTLTNNYNLAQKFDSNTGYNLLIQKHPGKSDEAYVINLTYLGQTYQSSFTLDRDKVVHFKNGQLTFENYDQRLDPIIDLFKNN